MSRLNTMDMDEAWVNEACDYLVPHAAGMFIWVTTVAKFLQKILNNTFISLKQGNMNVVQIDLKTCIPYTPLSSKHHLAMILKGKRLRQSPLLSVQQFLPNSHWTTLYLRNFLGWTH